jgi:hypothetical protein
MLSDKTNEKKEARYRDILTSTRKLLPLCIKSQSEIAQLRIAPSRAASPGHARILWPGLTGNPILKASASLNSARKANLTAWWNFGKLLRHPRTDALLAVAAPTPALWSSHHQRPPSEDVRPSFRGKQYFSSRAPPPSIPRPSSLPSSGNRIYLDISRSHPASREFRPCSRSVHLLISPFFLPRRVLPLVFSASRAIDEEKEGTG